MVTAATLDIARRVWADVTLRRPGAEFLAPQYDFFKFVNDSQSFTQFKDIATLPITMPLRSGGDAEEASFTSQYALTVTPAPVGLKFPMTFAAQQTDQYGIIKQAAGALYESAMHGRAKYAASILGNGFTTNCADGVPYFSASHPTKGGGGTYSNLVSASAFSSALVASMSTALRNQKSPSGLRIAAQGGAKLIVPPSLEDAALRALYSIQLAGTPNNDVNTLNQSGGAASRLRSIKLVVSDYLEDYSSTMYALVLDQADRTSLRWQDQIPFTPYEWTGAMKQLVVSCQMSYGAGATGGYGYVGNAGA